MARAGEPVYRAVALARGVLDTVSGLQLLDVQSQVVVPAASLAAERLWPDGSVHWLSARFNVTLAAHETRRYQIVASSETPPDAETSLHTPTRSAVQSLASASRPRTPGAGVSPLIDLDEATSTLGIVLQAAGMVIAPSLRLHVYTVDDVGRYDRWCVESFERQASMLDERVRYRSAWRVSDSRTAGFGARQPGAVQVSQTGRGLAPTEASAEPLSLKLDIDHDERSGRLTVELIAHNPRAAFHAGGLWDLGDPATHRFHEIGVEIEHPDNSCVSLSLENVDQRSLIDAVEAIDLLQFGSGVDGTVGYRMTVSGATPIAGSCHKAGSSLPFVDNVSESTRKSLSSGVRAEPIGTITYQDAAVDLQLPRFWQEYPTRLSLDATKTRIGLFASVPASGDSNDASALLNVSDSDASSLQELQPGERKRRRFQLQPRRATDERTLSLCRPLSPARVDADTRLASDHADRALTLTVPLELALGDLLITPTDFKAKRERINEFGWRDFGEVFADHESLYLEVDAKPFVSHYNNQYDVVLGFGLQFMRTGDAEWLELMDDLARHVVDIDIYRTDRDRVEYNKGLFWHTNHYEDAGTATHRTYSRVNHDPEQPVGSSGGPGPEHCYTTGLALHALLCSDVESARTVVDLACWMRDSFEGDPGLLGRIQSIARRELPLIKLVLRREASRNNLSSYRYPFTRATGNYVVACLDAYGVSDERQWLDRIGEILSETFHADDDIAARGLKDAENTWSHTVLLQAVLRYLSCKESIGETDSSYVHARDAFVAYARDMMEERGAPYLDRPDTLEFPNDTWAAQDIRRSAILTAAANYDPGNADRYRAVADCIGSAALSRLGNSETVHFTRIQALLMQNLGLASAATAQIVPPRDTLEAGRSRPRTGFRQLIGRVVLEFARGLRGFSLAHERHWLRLRR